MADLLARQFGGLVTDLGDLSREVENEFRRGWQFEKVLTRLRQHQAAAANPERRTIDGLGQVTMTLDPVIYHYWGQKLGYSCWRDKQFRKEMLRDNPEVRVKTVKKTMIVKP